MIIDTHSHYNLEPFYPDWQPHWQTAQDHGVVASMVVGTDIVTSHKAVELATHQPAFKAAVGVHPTEYDTQRTLTEDIAILQELVEKNSVVVAIGETGLDYFRLPEDIAQAESIKAQQQTAFAAHLELASLHQLPVIVHARDKAETAYWDILNLVNTHFTSQQPFILHCVSGPLPYIQKALSMGAYVGVAGNVTYKNADHLRAIVKTVPPERLLLETDIPFLPPQNHRGQTCEPWMIRETADYLRTELGIPTEQLYHNAKQIFNFPNN